MTTRTMAVIEVILSRRYAGVRLLLPSEVIVRLGRRIGCDQRYDRQCDDCCDLFHLEFSRVCVFGFGPGHCLSLSCTLRASTAIGPIMVEP